MVRSSLRFTERQTDGLLQKMPSLPHRKCTPGYPPHGKRLLRDDNRFKMAKRVPADEERARLDALA
jgi:hypothetical protein